MLLQALPFILFICGDAFETVIIPAVYKEWVNAIPDWVTNKQIHLKYNLSIFLYQKLNSSAPNYIKFNRGTEGAVYLKYIVDNYDKLPDK